MYQVFVVKASRTPPNVIPAKAGMQKNRTVEDLPLFIEKIRFNSLASSIRLA